VAISNAIHDQLEFIRDQLVRQPTPIEILRLVLSGAALTVELIPH
jgi:hypothetical protein